MILKQKILCSLLKSNSLHFRIKFQLKVWLGIYIVLIYTSLAFGQSKKIDSLLRVLPQLNNDSLRIKVMNELSSNLRQVEIERALHFANEALGLAKRTKQLYGIADAYGNLGSIAQGQGDYPQAIKYFYQALEIREKLQNQKLIATCLNSIAFTYYSQMNYTEALNYYKKALNIRKAIKDEEGLGYTYNGLGLTHEKMNHLDSALFHYQQALFYRKKIGNQARVAGTISNLAGYYYISQNYTQALRYARDAIKIFRKFNEKHNLLDALLHQTRILHKLKNFDEAFESSRECLELARKLGSKNYIKEVYKTLSEIYQDMGDYENALQSYQQYSVYKDSIFNIERSREFNRFRAERKESENKILHTKSQYREIKISNQQLIIQRQSIWIFVIIFGLIAGAGLVFFLWFTNKKLKSSYTLLNQKSREITRQKEQITQIADSLLEANIIINEQKNELSRSLEFKDKLFAVVSHDFKSPLNSLQGALLLFKQGVISAEQTQDILIKLTDKVAHTLNFVDNLLYWAKSQMQGIEPHPQILDLKTITQENIDLYQSQASQKQVCLDSKISDPIFAWADNDMIKLVLRNLISNAIKFTKNQDRIEVSAISENGHVHVWVSDTGQGIAPENQDKLFGKENYSTAGTANEIGTGLGLMVCKEFVEKNEGHIWVESSLGKGSTFHFTLPSLKAKSAI
jgi:two-component system, sensor histidine kinase and response regulator